MKLVQITQDQEIKVLKLVLTYLDRNPGASPSQVPEITLYYLNEVITCNYFKQVKDEAPKPFSRMTSLRNSIKNLTGRKPLLRMPADNKDKQSRSVTFNEVPTVYKISIKK